MGQRAKLAADLLKWVDSEAFELTSAGTGWPSHFRARTSVGWTSIAVYLGPIGQSHRGRGAVERRFQNPGRDRPITQNAD